MSTSPPVNVILLVGEDLGRHLGCYGDPCAHTPNLDRLADEGCVYNNAFSTAPVCAPSRSALVTGQSAWSLGTHHMRSTLLHPPRLFTHELRDAGYYVNWENKTDFNFDPPTDFADETCPWLDRLREATLPDQPWFLFHNFAVTHESTMWDRPDQPGAWETRQRLQTRMLDLSRHDPADMRVPPYLPDTPEVRADLARYYDAVTIADRQVGAVLDALDASPQRDRTLVIFMSDHGRGLPREKRWCYGAGIHLPLIVRWPGMIEPGSRCDDLVSWVDIAPTILSAGGVEVPGHYQGQVFVGPQQAPPRSYIFAGRDRMDENFDRVRVCRDPRYHYIRNYYPQLPYAQRLRFMEHQATMQAMRRLHAQGALPVDAQHWMAPTKPAEELYDAQADPDMVRNLAGDPAHAEKLHELRAALDGHLKQFGDRAEQSERQLVEQGLIKNRIEEYRQRIEPLPTPYRIGPRQSVLEMEEAGRL